MFDNETFQKLVTEDRPTGEVVAIDRFLIKVRGLDGVPNGAMILFANGDRGFVREVTPDYVMVLNLTSEVMIVGTLAVMEQEIMSVMVGEAMIGRVVSPLGEPLDGKGPILSETYGEVFAQAPGISERALLSDQLVTGVPVVDYLFGVVLGQRIAVLGDSKTGKTAFLGQMIISQTGSDRIIVYVMIAKRKADVDRLVSTLEASGAIKQCIIVVANIFDSLGQSYVAPYAGAAMGEYLWKVANRDVVMVYDDLSNHARAYREISLLSRVDPGRDSYPGDMFYAHSSLLERAGKLASNGKTMAALPVVLTPSDDITAYLPTTIMSITDGQVIFDLQSFREGIRPAVNTGLSVSRVGGSVQSKRVKKVSVALFKKLADYRAAAQFSHFGSEMSEQAQADFELGQRIYDAFRQTPDVIYSLAQQELIIGAVLKSEGKIKIDVAGIVKQAKELAGPTPIEDDAAFDALVDKILKANTKQAAPAPQPEAAPPPPPPTGKKDKKDKKSGKDKQPAGAVG